MINWTAEKLMKAKRAINIPWKILASDLGYPGIAVKVNQCMNSPESFRFISKHGNTKLTNENISDVMLPLMYAEIDKIRNDAEFEIKKIEDLLSELQSS